MLDATTACWVCNYFFFFCISLISRTFFFISLFLPPFSLMLCHFRSHSLCVCFLFGRSLVHLYRLTENIIKKNRNGGVLELAYLWQRDASVFVDLTPDKVPSASYVDIINSNG